MRNPYTKRERYEPFREDAERHMRELRTAQKRIMAGEPPDGTHMDYLLRIKLGRKWLDILRQKAKAHPEVFEAEELEWLKFKARESEG